MSYDGVPKVRARVWSTGGQVIRQPKRGTLPGGWTWQSKKPKHQRKAYRATWHFEVYNSAGEVVLYDNTGDYQTILQAALIRVEALRHMEVAGHQLSAYRG